MKVVQQHLGSPVVIAVVVAIICVGVSRSQVPEDPFDPNGVAIPHRFIHLVHTTDVRQKGGTAYLRSYDPFLFYQLGRDLVQREFTPSLGAYGRPGELSVPLFPNGIVVRDDDARFARDHTSSCGICHSIPFGEPGAGQTIASTSGTGRSTTHFFGGGLVEMIGEQTKQVLLNRYDKNRNGVFDRAEVAKSSPALIKPTHNSPPIDYGNLQPDSHGIPRLNFLFRYWYLDSEGRVVEDAEGLNDKRVAAFDITMQPFGWGRGSHLSTSGRILADGGEASTLRTIYTQAADVHMGLQAYDPTQHSRNRTVGQRSRGPGGVAGVSLNGAQQYDFGGAPDFGLTKSSTGISLDDPDRDGTVNELTEGDVDAAEFYMLHSPAPAVRSTPLTERGRQILLNAGCGRCHTENWTLFPRDAAKGFAGDRRLFSVSTKSQSDSDGVPRLSATLVRRHQTNANGTVTPLYGGASVERIYSDFKQWDIGQRFYERRFDGSLQKEHRTAPLWGVGSTAPYGHTGEFQTLDEVIRAHAGAAEHERNIYLSLPDEKRRLLITYLRSLALYQTSELPTKLNYRARLSKASSESITRSEGFDVRVLFRIPPLYKVFRNVVSNERTISLAFIENIDQAYGLDLPFCRDSDGDSFPDVIDSLRDKRGVTR